MNQTALTHNYGLGLCDNTIYIMDINWRRVA